MEMTGAALNVIKISLKISLELKTETKTVWGKNPMPFRFWCKEEKAGGRSTSKNVHANRLVMKIS